MHLHGYNIKVNSGSLPGRTLQLGRQLPLLALGRLAIVSQFLQGLVRGNPGLVKVLGLGQEIDLGLEESALVLDLETRRDNYGTSCLLGLSHPLNRKKLIIQKPVCTKPTSNC